MQEKPSSLKSPLRFSALLKEHLSITIVAFFALLLTSAVTLSVPGVFSTLIDRGLTAGSQSAADRSFWLLSGMAVLLAAGTAGRYYSVSVLGERIYRSLRTRFFDKILTLSPSDMETFASGDLLSRFGTDAETIRNFAGSSLSVAVRNVFLLFGGLAAMLMTAPKLTLFTACVVPFVIAPVFVLSKKLKALTAETATRNVRADARMSEALSALETVQSSVAEKYEQNIHAQLSKVAETAAIKRFRLRSLLTFIVILFVFCAIVLVLREGAVSVLAGRMSPGALARFVLYSVFTAGAVSALTDISSEAQKASAALARLSEILMREPEIASPVHSKKLVTPVLGAIEYKNVRFAYPLRPNYPIFENLNLSIKAGEKIALIGSSGGGKTALLQLLLRFRDPQAGNIMLDGVNINDLTLRDLRNLIAYMPQKPDIFNDTIYQNILIARPDATENQVISASKAAELHDFILTLPEQYQTPAGEGGRVFSGGQKQRLAFARVILKNAPVVLLDEPSSALDSETEAKITAASQKIFRDKTVITIAHRLTTVLNADRICVLEKGKIVEQGKHDELWKQNGLYRILAERQFIQNGQNGNEKEKETGAV